MSAPVLGERERAVDDRPRGAGRRHFQIAGLNAVEIRVKRALALAADDLVVERLGIGEQFPLVAIGRQVEGVSSSHRGSRRSGSSCRLSENDTQAIANTQSSPKPDTRLGDRVRAAWDEAPADRATCPSTAGDERVARCL